jgi:hypothetical protein
VPAADHITFLQADAAAKVAKRVEENLLDADQFVRLDSGKTARMSTGDPDHVDLPDSRRLRALSEAGQRVKYWRALNIRGRRVPGNGRKPDFLWVISPQCESPFSRALTRERRYDQPRRG